MAESPTINNEFYDAIHMYVSVSDEVFLYCEPMTLATVKATLRALKIRICQLLTVL